MKSRSIGVINMVRYCKYCGNPVRYEYYEFCSKTCSRIYKIKYEPKEKKQSTLDRCI